MNTLNISTIQFSQVWESKQDNIDQIEKLLKSIPKETNIIVLPEMFTTSFTMNAQSNAENFTSSPTIAWMKRCANSYDCAICGSLIIEDGGHYYNRFLFVEADGKIQYYDKRHLFKMAGEDNVFTKGNEQIIIEYKTWKILPQVCYDLRFPVWSRNTMDYDICIYVANWPVPRIKVWDILLQARAIENQCFVVGCNRIGQDVNNLTYTGSSQIIDPKGNIISKLIDSPGIVSASISKTERETFKKKFNVLSDADQFFFDS